LFATLAAAADEPAPAQAPAPVPENPQVTGPEQAPEAEAKNLLSIDGGADFTTAYVFRGYTVQDEGLISQPYVNLSLNIPQMQDIGGSGVGVTPFVGTWNSIHTKGVAWYESDILGGVNVSRGNFTLTLQYTYYSYPGGGKIADTSQEFSGLLSYDDSEFWQKAAPKLPGFAFSPHVLVARELDRSAVLDNTGPQTYIELGMEPSIDVALSEKTTLTVSAPTLLGLTPDHYYEDSDGESAGVGYLSVAVKLALPLPVPEKFGSWKVTAAATYLHDYADSAKAANGGHADKVIGTVGFGFSF
jgi:hypothetical protein